MKRFLLYFLLLLFCTKNTAAQPNLGQAEETVKKHLEEIRNLYDQAEQRGKRIAQKAVQDAKAGGDSGAAPHPWASPAGNVMSGTDYFLDSYFMTRFDAVNFVNHSNIYGCHEPGTLAYRELGYNDRDKISPSGILEAIACKLNCLVTPIIISFICPKYTWDWSEFPWPFWDSPWHPNGPYKSKSDFASLNNGYEVIEYWWPEYQASINNYGINRLNPAGLPKAGSQFTRQALLGQKMAAEEQLKQNLDQEYPTNSAGFQNPNRTPPQLGQGAWGGYAWPDFEEKAYAHVARVQLTWEFSDQRKETHLGYMDSNSEIQKWTFADAFPPRSTEHDVANIWTEYGIWDTITSIPHFSYNLGNGAAYMQALHGPKTPISQKAREENPFWQNQGAMAFRAAKWRDLYQPLEDVLKVSPNANALLSEIVYRGGYELYPLVTNMSGFGAPTLSAAAIFARRAFELAGMPAMAGNFPGGPSARIMQYTIDAAAPNREIDKMQLIFPRRPAFGSPQFPVRMQESIAYKLSECYRSQRIPNFTDPDTTQLNWAKKNFPADLTGYVKDFQLISHEGGDVTVGYWNRRIDCSCKLCGVVKGTLNLNAGDRPRDERKILPLCKFRRGATYSALTGAGKDTVKEDCLPFGPVQIPDPFVGPFIGLQDNI